MPKIEMFNMKGESVGTKELSDEVFAAPIREGIVHTAVKVYLANQRQGNQSTLTRAEVAGGGAKPWRQKGTGRARHGSRRSPIWTHGGITFGPKPRSHRMALNKQARRAALKSVLTAKVAAGELVVVDEIKMDEYKTKVVTGMLAALGADKKALIVTGESNPKLIKSAGNIPGVKTALAASLNVYDILNCDKFIVSSAAVDKIEEVYA